MPMPDTVPPLEALWRANDMTAFVAGTRNDWRWTAMIMQLNFVSDKDLTTMTVTPPKMKQKVTIHDWRRLASAGREEGCSGHAL